MEMNDKELLDLIAGGSKIVVDVWGDNCPYCVEFAPIFDSVAKEFPEIKFVKFNLPKVGSEFKRKYMTLQSGSNGVPAIFVFEKGEQKFRHHGKIDAEKLKAFVNDGVDPMLKEKDQAKLELVMLFARRGEITFAIDELPQVDNKIKQIKQFLGST